MGAALSKLWGSLRSALGGGSAAGGKSNQQPANGPAKDVENNLPATDTPAKPATPIANMAIKKYKITEPWIKLNCSLGEGPFWDETTNTLRFLDVEKLEVHTVDLNVGASSHKILKKYDFSMGVTADIEGNDEEFIFGGKFGYGVANKKTGESRWIKKVWNEEELKAPADKANRYRGNDGAVDSQGRFWVGFMTDPMVQWPPDAEGAVFRLDPDLSLHRPLDNITIPNGTTWNAADDTFYWADSPFRTIYKFDYDVSSGTVTNKRTYFTMPETTYGKDAVPDGHCIDEEGYMWTAVHGGAVVLRISPEGEVVAEIDVPTQNPTCPCFCGDELVITSAGGTSGPDGTGIDENAGSVFKINVGVRGLKKYKFKGAAALEGAVAE